MTGAALRGALVAAMVMTPSFILPEYTSDAPEVSMLMALLAALLTFSEYRSDSPSFVEFRDAPPYNRIRFVALFAMVLVTSLIVLHRYEPAGLNLIVSGLSAVVSGWLDFPYSPVRLLVLVVGEGNRGLGVETIRAAAGITYVIGMAGVLALLMAIRLHGWPAGKGAFNVWVNLPLFDPTVGGDVVARLRRDGRINVALGLVLPFLLPGVLVLFGDRVGPIRFSDPHTIIWMIVAWAFLPASTVMRGIATIQVARLIEMKRRRAYASAMAEEAIQAA
ncbi:hypothetical protein ACFQBU_09280 [Jhaorihella thermophila]|uniref:Uncharacterized protein n=3 Tax=Jhaorihella thermophila TaxID=488547 RepID=A0A1H5WIB8_9RHOB|nr:hypothetical protein SAMN05421751_10818 [Jhaorihella thermophila]